MGYAMDAGFIRPARWLMVLYWYACALYPVSARLKIIAPFDRITIGGPSMAAMPEAQRWSAFAGPPSSPQERLLIQGMEARQGRKPSSTGQKMSLSHSNEAALHHC